ncbi:hypothetical protein SOVF_070160 [Spinacia oleracea]|nr:hypothetical protein SOVF_070160 [Spinacia oleracea]
MLSQFSSSMEGAIKGRRLKTSMMMIGLGTRQVVLPKYVMLMLQKTEGLRQ